MTHTLHLEGSLVDTLMVARWLTLALCTVNHSPVRSASLAVAIGIVGEQATVHHGQTMVTAKVPLYLEPSGSVIQNSTP